MAHAVGLDFGTTNTVAAMANSSNHVEMVQFGDGPEALSTFRSVVSFWREQESGSLRTDGGPWAIEHFIEFPAETRFLQSFKTFAGSPLFDTTGIFGKRFRFEDILEAFFRTALKHGGEPLRQLPKTLVVGRPVKFAGQNANAETARARYEAAFTRFGFERIVHVLEPVAAAYYYAQRLTASANVLVGDFGGGTSDFSILRFDGAGKDFRALPLAHAGVGLAGDTFDYRIIDAVISPRLGKGSLYESWGKLLTLPSHYFATFAKWNELCLLKHSPAMRELKALSKLSTEPEKLDSLIRLISPARFIRSIVLFRQSRCGFPRNPKQSLSFATRGSKSVRPFDGRILRPGLNPIWPGSNFALPRRSRQRASTTTRLIRSF